MHMENIRRSMVLPYYLHEVKKHISKMQVFGQLFSLRHSFLTF